MSRANALPVPAAQLRRARGWSQADLALRAGIARTTISAIEGQRLTPSVTAALALARTLECSVEELFGASGTVSQPEGTKWAWEPTAEPCRYWEAEVAGRRWLYPVEATAASGVRHDGVWQGGIERDTGSNASANTLVMACCDPSAGLLAGEYARASGFRMLVLQRGGTAALDLLQRGLVHVAGVHRSTTDHPGRNAETVRERLGTGYRLLRAAQWQEGVVLAPGDRTRLLSSVSRQSFRWAMREPGSAARECLDELLGSKSASGRAVRDHGAVAAAVSAGWAEAGVCVRLSAEDAGLHFLPVRTEALDFCFAASAANDPRLLALIRLLRSRAHRRLVSELPGYDARQTGEIERV